MAYLSKTDAIADFGGEYVEGIVGQPLHVNPVISQSNNADEDIAQIVYSGLLKFDNNGNTIPDLAESYEISDDKMEYTFHLRKNVLWHDGQPFTADDVLYTTAIISDPSYKSPLRQNWQGVETSSSDDYIVSFKIKTPFVGFLNNLTFGVLPKHIWEQLPADKFTLTDLNLQPIGTGPYKYSSIQKDSNGNIISYKLVANPNYFEGKPYISKVTFNFYADEEATINAYNTKEVMGINSITPQKIEDIKLKQSPLIHKISLPRYFAVFFNQTKNVPLANDEIRDALQFATNRQEIIDAVLGGSGKSVYSPFLPGMLGHTDNLEKKEFNLDQANKILDDNKWMRENNGFRAKDGVMLEFDLTTTDWPELVHTAEILKAQWEKIGVKVNVNSYSISDIQQNYIRTREYDALLFGQVLGSDPDPYSFWHSSQKRDPGLNLSLFGNSETDALIESGRTEFDSAKRIATYEEFQKSLLKESPAVFLYSPDYIHIVNKKVQNINVQNLSSPEHRFSDINHWYISTRRVWK